MESTFMYLTLDLPTAPLYKDEKEQLIIPQVPLFNILAKFNGITEKVTHLHTCPAHNPFSLFLSLFFNISFFEEGRLCWVFVAACELSLAVVSGGYCLVLSGLLIVVASLVEHRL